MKTTIQVIVTLSPLWSDLKISCLQPTCDYFYALNKLSVSQHDTLSHCVCLSESYYNCMSPQRWSLADSPSANEHSYFITFITDGYNPETLSFGALTLINRWETCDKTAQFDHVEKTQSCQVGLRMHKQCTKSLLSVVSLLLLCGSWHMHTHYSGEEELQRLNNKIYNLYFLVLIWGITSLSRHA